MVLVLRCFVTSNAQEVCYQNYASNAGLSNNACYALHQDRQGFIWIATNTGLERFDGTSIKNFNEDYGFDGTLLRKIQEDSLGRIWVMTYFDGLYHAKDSTNAFFTKYEFNKEVQSLGPGPTDFAIEKKNGIRIDFSSRKIIGVGRKKNSTVGFQTEGTIFHSPKFKKTFFSPNKFIDKIVYISKRDSQRFVIPPISDVGAFAIYLDSNRLLYSKYLIQITKDSCLLDTLPDKATCFEPLGNGEYLLGTISGLWHCNEALQKRRLLISNILVSDILIDRQKNIWVATKGKGIYKIPSLDIITYDVVEKDASSLIGFSTGIGKELIVYSKDKIYTKGANSSVVNLMFQIDQPDTRIRDVLERPETDEKVLVCNFGQPNIWMINNEGPLKTRQFPSSHQVHHGRYREDKLFLTAADGMYQYDFDKNEAKPLQADTAVVLCHSLEMDNKGMFWCGGMGKIYRETPEGLATVIDLETLIIGLDFCQGHLVVATLKKGIRLLDTASMKLTSIRKTDGLSDDVMTNIMVHKNEIWVSSKKGINQIVRRGDKWKVITPYISSVLNFSIVQDMVVRNDSLWLCLSHSIVSAPLDATFPDYIWPVLITDVGPTEGGMTNVASSFAYDESDLKVHFSEPNFLNLQGEKYLYRLLGAANEEWNAISSQYLTFPSLQPGEYEFQIKSRPFSDEVSMPAASTVAFAVMPPIWKTWWFISLEVLMSLVLMYVIIQYRSTQLANREVLKTELIRLELKALKAQINPHFVYNAISSVQYYLSKNESSEAQKYMQDFAHLIRKVLEHSDKSLIPLQSELELIENYVDLESRKLEGEKLCFKQEISHQVKTEEVRVPPAIFQPFIENAIFHGLKSKKGERNLVLRVGCNSKHLSIEIEDDGVGRKKSSEGRQNLHKGPSFGMSIASERIRVLNGAKNADSVVVKDLVGQGGEALGTRVTLSIPYISLAQ